MTEDSSFTIRPQSGPSRSPEEIVKFYNKFDGWQEVLPKTDNTYSPGSKYYKHEVSPGIPFIPNMSRLPLKSYEKTPIKHDFSEVDYTVFASSHIRRKLFTSTTYKYSKGTNHNEIQLETEETFVETERKTFQVINYTYQSVKIFITFIVSYLISIFTSTNIHKSVMETGSNIINTTIRKITNWVHLTTIKLVHYDLVIIRIIRNVIDHYFGRTKMKNLVMLILFLALILFLTVGVSNSTKSLNFPVWQESWTNFLISPFISILNLITSIFRIFSSTIYFVFDLITVTFASILVGIKLMNQSFFSLFHNVNTIMSSATKFNTIPIDQNSRFIPFDYNLLAKKVLASEEFQRVLINQLNISQSDFIKLHDKEFQQLFQNQLEEMNSENLNLINDQLNEHKNTLKNINSKMSDQEKESIELMNKKISELQNILSNLINNFETFKSKSILKTNTESNKEACSKDDWNSIINYIEEYVNITMKSTLSIYDADKTGMVDYALESAGATVLGTRCTQTKASTAALTLFGIPLWFISNGPRLAIQPGVNPGQCWAFIGAKGFLVLRLSKTIRVTGFTLEHLPKSLSDDGHIRSAPKDFSIWGLRHETDSDGKILGKYQFKVDGPSLQYFSAEGADNYFSIVELRIESNHGHEEYTCLYRIRVHGDLA